MLAFGGLCYFGRKVTTQGFDEPKIRDFNICLVTTLNVDVSEVSIVAMSQCSSLRKSVRPQIDENDPKWVQNGRQDLRIGPQACRGHFLAFGTGPAGRRRRVGVLPPQPKSHRRAIFVGEVNMLKFGDVSFAYEFEG